MLRSPSNSTGKNIYKDSDEFKEEILATKNTIDKAYSEKRYQKLVTSPKESIRLKGMLNSYVNQNQTKQKILDNLVYKVSEMQIFSKDEEKLEKYDKKILRLNKKIEKALDMIDKEEENAYLFKNTIIKLESGLNIYKERIENIKEASWDVDKNHESYQIAKLRAKNDLVAAKNSLNSTITKFNEENDLFEGYYGNMQQKLEIISEEKAIEIEKLANMNMKNKEIRTNRDDFMLILKEETYESKENQVLSIQNSKKISNYKRQIEKILEIIRKLGLEEIKNPDIYLVIIHAWNQILSQEVSLHLDFQALTEEVMNILAKV